MIQVDISNIWGALSLPELLETEQDVAQAHAALAEAGMTFPPEEEMQAVLDAADKICSDSDVCLVLGTDEGCLEARAAVELLQGSQRNLTAGKPRLFFAGADLSARRWNELTALLEGQDFSVVMISQTGEAFAPSVAFRSLRWMLERKYGTDEASGRVYVVTDPESSLGRMAREEQWQVFPMSAAGLLPMAAAGIEIAQVVQGGQKASTDYDLRSFENPLWLYAGVRHALRRQGKTVELLDCPEPDFQAFGRWWQRLFAAGRIFPALFCGEGDWDQFVTAIRFDGPEKDVPLGTGWTDGAGLEGKTLTQLQDMAFERRAAELADRGVPVIAVDGGTLDAEKLGELFGFFRLARSICGLLP